MKSMTGKYEPLAIRSYRKSDLSALMRIWHEIGWRDSQSDESKNVLEKFMEGCISWVVESHGKPEVVVATMPGSVRYLDNDLSMWAIGAVTVGMPMRRRGAGSRLTSHGVADGAMRGADIAMLGCFDQGYYDRLGFGNGTSERRVHFDPAQLLVDAKPKNAPMRIEAKDWEMVHAARHARMRSHGSAVIEPPSFSHAEMLMEQNSFGYGYVEDGVMTHGFWGTSSEEGHKFYVIWMVYQNVEQLMELLWLLRSFSEQVDLVEMFEPPEINLHDLLYAPFRLWDARGHSHKRPVRFDSFSYWQARILSLESAIAKTPIKRRGSISFNVSIDDPIDRYLPSDHRWRGIAGKYHLTLGPEPKCERGHRQGEPHLEASVGAFTRMWLGVDSVAVIAATDSLSAPSSLLDDLGWFMMLPSPHTTWEF